MTAADILQQADDKCLASTAQLWRAMSGDYLPQLNDLPGFHNFVTALYHQRINLHAGPACPGCDMQSAAKFYTTISR